MARITCFYALVTLALYLAESAESVDWKKDCEDEFASVKTVRELRTLARQVDMNTESVPAQCVHKIKQLSAMVSAANENDVCHPSHIDLLADYHSNYLEPSEDEANSRSNENHNSFFTRYARATSLTCNRNLYYNLYNINKWLANQETEPESCPRNEQSSTPKVIKNELERFLEAITYPDQILLLRFMPVEAAILRKIPITERDELEQQIMGCKVLASQYENIIASIARLAHIGYGWESQTIEFFDQFHESKMLASKLPSELQKVLKTWLNVVHMCDPLLNQYIEYTVDGTDSVKLVESHSIVGKRNHLIETLDVATIWTNNIDFEREFAAVTEGTVEAKPVTEIESLFENYEELSPELETFLVEVVDDEDHNGEHPNAHLMRRKRDGKYREENNSLGYNMAMPFVLVGYVGYEAVAWCTYKPVVKLVKHVAEDKKRKKEEKLERERQREQEQERFKQHGKGSLHTS